MLEDADVLVESLHPDEARTLGLSPDETRDREVLGDGEPSPHFRARNVVVPVTHPEAGEFALYRSPIGLSATPGHIDRAAPCLGEHNDHVFLDVLGLSTGEYEAFKSDVVIR